MMRSLFRFTCVAAATLALLPTAALAQAAAPVAAPVNWHAIVDVPDIHRDHSRASPTGRPSGPRPPTDFYAAGRGITALQNGLALAGDYMSAASFLGIAGLVATSTASTA